MVIPQTIIAVAKSRKARPPLPGCHSRNVGEIRLRIKANITTNTGRLLAMAETNDTGPLSNAQNCSSIAVGASVSLTASKAKAEFLRFMLISCLRTWGRIERINKILDMQNALSQNIFQNEM